MRRTTKIELQRIKSEMQCSSGKFFTENPPIKRNQAQNAGDSEINPSNTAPQKNLRDVLIKKKIIKENIHVYC